MGERSARVTEILGDCKVSVEGDDIIIKGVSLEDVGQTAANLEQATKIKRKDQRIFLDGIYVYEKIEGLVDESGQEISETTEKERRETETKVDEEASRLARLLELRRSVAESRPAFVRPESWRYVRLHPEWRKPKGLDNKVRKSIKGWPRRVKVGYRGPLRGQELSSERPSGGPGAQHRRAVEGRPGKGGGPDRRRCGRQEERGR